jgi:Flp pilus assembly protein TadG
MRHPPARSRRQGIATVEFGLVCSAVFALVLSLIVGGLGIFRFQEVAHLAREGARYAATHGGQYQQDGIATSTGVSAVSSSDTLRSYLLPRTLLLTSSNLTITASWSGAGSVTPSNMPTYVNTDSNLSPPAQISIQNYVTVTVSYKWMPEVYVVGPITLTSTSTMPMSY